MCIRDSLSFDPLAPVLLERAKRLILTGQTAGQIEAAVKNAKGFAESGLVIDLSLIHI